MNKQEETFATWNKVAKLYEEKFMHLDLYNDSYDLFCAALPNEKTSVLDVACGPGNISKYLRHKMPACEMDAIDVSPNMIALARSNNPEANCMLMDCREINKLQQKYDGIINGFGVPYLSKEECAVFIIDAATLLNSKGILYISFVEGNYADSGFKAGNTGDRTYFYYHSLKELLNNLEDANFDIITTQEKYYENSKAITETHSIILARKNI